MRVTPCRRVPEGFVLWTEGRAHLWVREELLDGVRRAGLDDPVCWQERLATRSLGSGRGSTARCHIPGGPHVLLKKMRRGGITGPLWRGRYPGLRRLLDNLEVPLETARRGVPTVTPVAMLTQEGPPLLYQGWLAMEEIVGARDLTSRWEGTQLAGRAEIAATMRLVRRMHDAGIEHRDLNLGNLLLRDRPQDGYEAFVVDLDRARLHPAPLALRLRKRGLGRMWRSYVKLCGGSRPQAAEALVSWYSLYADGDEALLRRLMKGRSLQDAALALHRLRWRS